MTKRLSLLVIGISALFFLASITLSACVNKAFVNGVDSGVKVIAPEYQEYVKKDANLTAESKAIRLNTIQMLLKLIEEAKK